MDNRKAYILECLPVNGRVSQFVILAMPKTLNTKTQISICEVVKG
jgi:hypothetical protein